MPQPRRNIKGVLAPANNQASSPSLMLAGARPTYLLSPTLDVFLPLLLELRPIRAPYSWWYTELVPRLKYLRRTQSHHTHRPCIFSTSKQCSKTLLSRLASSATYTRRFRAVGAHRQCRENHTRPPRSILTQERIVPEQAFGLSGTMAASRQLRVISGYRYNVEAPNIKTGSLP